MPPLTALIGATGLVGGTLARQSPWTDHFRSTDIATIRGKKYDLLACAGASGTRWLVNSDPKSDLARCELLMSSLEHAQARRALLFSTVSVYSGWNGPDECTPTDPSSLDAYARNRLLLEEFFRSHFPRCTIVRLPGIFGPGLKKNLIFDLLHRQFLDRVHPKSRLQFYSLEHLWKDSRLALEAQLPCVNLVTEPVEAGVIAARCFGIVLTASKSPLVEMDIRTRHAAIFRRTGHYLQDPEEVLQAIGRFAINAGQDF